MPDPAKTAASLRRLLSKLEEQIVHKRRPMFEGQNMTYRRQQMQESSYREADRLEKVKRTVEALADMWELREVPDLLQKVTSRALIEDLRIFRGLPGYNPELKRFYAAGLDSDEKVAEAHELLCKLGEVLPDPEKEVHEKIRLMEAEHRLQTGRGWFWTPSAVALRMIDEAGICADHKILEPSAGLGDIVDQLPHGKAWRDNISVVEANYSRREVLELKGYQVAGTDFLEMGQGGWNRILMNPPFENFQDIEHVRHAYKLLAPGGRIVAVMSPGPFFRGEKKALEFREWLDGKGWSEDLPAGSFKEAGTGVATKLVVIDKPGEEELDPSFEVPFNGVANSEVLLSDMQVARRRQPRQLNFFTDAGMPLNLGM